MSRKLINWKLDLLSTASHVAGSLLLIAVLCGSVMFCDIATCSGQVTGSSTGTVIGLAAAGQAEGTEITSQFLEFERQLNAILRTRRDEEKEFVGLVVNQIRLGRIPSKLVSTSFDWVRNKRPNTKYPFVYFERVLRLQAERLELASEIPPFDFSIYSETTQPLPNEINSAQNNTGVDEPFTSRNSGFEFQGGTGVTDRQFGSLDGAAESGNDSIPTERTTNLFRILLNQFQ